MFVTFFRGQFNEGARRVERRAREHCEMFAVALREEVHRELISVEGSSASRQARVQEELTRARHGEEYSVGLWKTEMANARAQAATEQEVAVARCRSSAAAALDNARAHAENHCERLEEGFTRERDRAAVADLVLEDMAAQLRDEQTMVSEHPDTALGMQAQVDEFVDQYAESTKRVFDRECSDVKKHEQDFVRTLSPWRGMRRMLFQSYAKSFISPGCRFLMTQAWRSNSKDSWRLIPWSLRSSALGP